VVPFKEAVRGHAAEEVVLRYATTVRLVFGPAEQAAALWGLRAFVARLTLRSGFLGYDLLQDLEQPGTYVLVERWSSIDALRQHLRSDSYLELLSVMEMARQQPVFEIEKVEPMAGPALLGLIRRVDKNDAAPDVPRE